MSDADFLRNVTGGFVWSVCGSGSISTRSQCLVDGVRVVIRLYKVIA